MNKTFPITKRTIAINKNSHPIFFVFEIAFASSLQKVLGHLIISAPKIKANAVMVDKTYKIIAIELSIIIRILLSFKKISS